MSKGLHHSSGSFVRWELMTTASASACHFYRELFGWQTLDEETPDAVIYSHLIRGDRKIGGIYSMSPELAARPAAPHWLPYVGVLDADKSLADAKASGAKVTAESFDFAGIGRMALLIDPTGAPFGLWQDSQNKLPQGTVAWHELSTHDTRAASDFYGDMFGWQANEPGRGQLSIQTLLRGDRPMAALISLGPRFKAVPSHWLPYFQVEDMNRALATIIKNGGRVMAQPVTHEWGAQAVAQDPQGAVFGVSWFS